MARSALLAEANGAKGVAQIAFTSDGEKGPIIKFFSDEQIRWHQRALDVEPQTSGSLLLQAVTAKANAMRSSPPMAEALIIPREKPLLWVVNFPCSERGRAKYGGHPFTHVLEDLDKIESRTR